MWRIVRSLVQLAAGGGLTVLFNQIAQDTNDKYDPYVFMLATLVVIVAQNLYESMSGAKLIGPQVVSTKAAENAVEQAYTATPGVDPIPEVKA
jgi:superfamily II DNA or RNA helicase